VHMRIQRFEITDRTVVLGLVAAYATGAVIFLALLINLTVWPAVSHAL
jgi:hypothetical protein